ncbi:hypothetical protein BAZ12_11395 [Elizabethkingia miricola]|uniref:DUF308 domain-containing protein n=1 Tax=Elizabethkingia miricola TaxID=172045 RepID=A0AAQ1PLB5_ELIMR|nr:hypothetical protein ATB95_06530 [Elizabethkingia miricola]OPC16751.1 hypothetical protein BAY01_03370 [Elizabethkingia miricola]OPC36754.1 hypothetical protein BAX99_17250 [Elizabethkingia miricola]OPC70380.1 hypothetical protein BAZ12_11395 [Elizabethkingia miricola]OPC74309.1 hypothetical protein BAZ13_04665 [Elizabethkingia miricola]
MVINSSDYPFKTATINWYFLSVTGILSFITGLYLLIIPVDIYRILVPLFQIVFATIGLGGIIFTTKDQKTIRSIIPYLCYIVIILITTYSFTFSSNKVMGLISLYCYIKFLSITIKLKKYNSLKMNTINIIINLIGFLFSLMLIVCTLAENLYVKIILVFCYILYGISSFFISLELKALSRP